MLTTLTTAPISRSSMWRIRHDVDLQPQKSAYWLHSHDEDCEAKAHSMCQRYVQALEAYEQGRLVIGCDEKTGRQVLERKAPPKPAQPGRRERREPEDIRRGTRVLIHSLAVATGQRAWTLGATRTTTDFVAHLQHADQPCPRMQRSDWVLDNVQTHWSLDVCRLGARWCKVPCAPDKRQKGVQRRACLSDPSHHHVFPCTPKHGAWLNQVE